MDIKYLNDIPPYWEQMERFKLSRFQYTLREVKSGIQSLKPYRKQSENVLRFLQQATASD